MVYLSDLEGMASVKLRRTRKKGLQCLQALIVLAAARCLECCPSGDAPVYNQMSSNSQAANSQFQNIWSFCSCLFFPKLFSNLLEVH